MRGGRGEQLTVIGRRLRLRDLGDDRSLGVARPLVLTLPRPLWARGTRPG